jgi:hypothetical protein
MPRSALLGVAAAASALAMAGCAAVPEEPRDLPANISTARQCFFTGQINGYAEAPRGSRSRERFTVRTGARDEWLLETFGSCPAFSWSNAIALDTRGINSLCTGQTATVLVPSTLGTDRVDRCTVRVLGKVIPAPR